MSQQYAIYRNELVYDDEFYIVQPCNQTLYDIAENEKIGYQRLATLEREKLTETDIESFRVFGDGELSDEAYQAIQDFVIVECGLPLTVYDDGCFEPEEIPVDDMSDQQLLKLLELATINQFVIKPYVASPPRYVLSTQDQSYVGVDPSGYSNTVWFTFDGEDVIEQYFSEFDEFSGWDEEDKKDIYGEKEDYTVKKVDDFAFTKINQDAS